MTITTFQRQCIPGKTVVKEPKKKRGTVFRISKDRDKALVLYENGSKQWDPYYTLEFETPNS